MIVRIYICILRSPIPAQGNRKIIIKKYYILIKSTNLLLYTITLFLSFFFENLFLYDLTRIKIC